MSVGSQRRNREVDPPASNGPERRSCRLIKNGGSPGPGTLDPTLTPCPVPCSSAYRSPGVGILVPRTSPPCRLLGPLKRPGTAPLPEDLRSWATWGGIPGIFLLFYPRFSTALPTRVSASSRTARPIWSSPRLTVMRSCTGLDVEDPHAAVPAVVACTCFFVICPVDEEPSTPRSGHLRRLDIQTESADATEISH